MAVPERHDPGLRHGGAVEVSHRRSGACVRRGIAAAVQKQDGDPPAVSRDPDVRLEGGAGSRVAVGDAAAPGRVAAAPEAARLHQLQLFRAEELPLHERDEKAAGLLGVGDDGALCADARVRRGHVRKRAAGGDGVTAGVLARDGALGVVCRVTKSERLEDPPPVERLDARPPERAAIRPRISKPMFE